MRVSLLSVINGGGGGGDSIQVVQSDVTTTNNASSYINVPDLQVLIPAGSHCIMEFTIIANTNATADFSAEISADVEPGVNYFYVDRKAADSIARSIVFDPFSGGLSSPTFDTFDSASGINVFKYSGVAYGGLTDTTITFGFKQLSSSGTTTIKAGSVVKFKIQ